jgi:hypothetical protein
MGSKKFLKAPGSGPSGPLQTLRPKTAHAPSPFTDGFDGQQHRKRLPDGVVEAGLQGSPPPDAMAAFSDSIVKQHERHGFAFSRHEMPEVCVTFHPLTRKRAQGKPGARCTRGLACKV